MITVGLPLVSARPIADAERDGAVKTDGYSQLKFSIRPSIN